MRTTKYYINRNGDGHHETVDEFEDRDEAQAMLTEYQVSDPAGQYRISRQPRPGWSEDEEGAYRAVTT